MLKIKNIKRLFAIIGTGITLASFSGCVKQNNKETNENNETSVSSIENIDVEIPDNEEYWWPIGSKETLEENGKLFASKLPVQSIIVKKFSYEADILKNSNSEEHEAIDITSNEEETNIIAAKSGIVVYPNESDRTNYNQNDPDSTSYGNYVIIKHYDGNYTLYAHLKEDSITVKAGDEVKQGQVIGKLGNTGLTTGDNLHFEIRVGGNTLNRRVNPESYVTKEKSRESNGIEFVSIDQFIDNAANVIKIQNTWELKLDDITLYTLKDEDLLNVLDSLSYHLKKDKFTMLELEEYHLKDVVLDSYKEESYTFRKRQF